MTLSTKSCQLLLVMLYIVLIGLDSTGVWADPLSWIRIGLHLTVLVLFLFFMRLSMVSAVGFYIGLLVVSGVNGSFQQNLLGVPLSILIFILFLVAGPLITGWQSLVERVRHSLYVQTGVVPLMLLGMLSIGWLIALSRNIGLKAIFADSDAWLFIAFFGVCLCLPADDTVFNRLVRMFTVACGIASMVVVTVFVLLTIGLIGVPDARAFLYQTLSLGGHIEILGYSAIHRVYTGNTLAMLPGIACALLLTSAVGGPLRQRLFWCSMALSMLLAQAVSMTRGYWLALIVEIVVIAGLLEGKRRVRFISLISIVVAVSLMVSIALGGHFLSAAAERFVRLFHYAVSDELVESKHEKIAIATKVEQYKVLLEYINLRPVFGFGFGSTLPLGISPRTHATEIGPAYIFEAGYGDMLFKVGVVGFILWFLAFGLAGRAWYRVYRLSLGEERVLLLGFGAAILAFLVSFATNPYIHSLFSVLPMVFLLGLVEQVAYVRSCHGNRLLDDPDRLKSFREHLINSLHNHRQALAFSRQSTDMLRWSNHAIRHEQDIARETLIKGWRQLMHAVRHLIPASLLNPCPEPVTGDERNGIRVDNDDRLRATRNSEAERYHDYAAISWLIERSLRTMSWSPRNARGKLTIATTVLLLLITMLLLLWWQNWRFGVRPGFLGAYYQGRNFERPIVLRFDEKINFTWGNGSPDPRIHADKFSIRWTAFLIVPEEGPVRFTTLNDDGVRIYLDDQLVIDDWKGHRPLKRKTVIHLAPGKYTLKIDYFDDILAASCIVDVAWADKNKVRRKPLLIQSSNNF